jgi:hypothetical protein
MFSTTVYAASESKASDFVIKDGVLTEYKGKDAGKISIPEGVKEIAKGVLYKKGLTEVILPSTLEKIGIQAFYANWSLKSITIPASVKNIAGGAFAGTGLEEIIFQGTPESIAVDGLIQNPWFEKTFSALCDKYGLNNKLDWGQHWLYTFANGKAPFEVKGKFGVVDLNGNVLLEPIYEGVRVLADGGYEVKTGGKWQLLGKDGKAEEAYVGENLTIVVDENQIIFPGQQPIFKGNEGWLVPALWAFRAIGWKATWDNTTQSFDAVLGGKCTFIFSKCRFDVENFDARLTMPLGKNQFTLIVGDKSSQSGVYSASCQLIGNCVMLPIDIFLDIAKKSGDFSWDESSNVINLKPGLDKSYVLTYHPDVPKTGGPYTATFDEKFNITGWISEAQAREKIMAVEKIIPNNSKWEPDSLYYGCNGFARRAARIAFGGKINQTHGEYRGSPHQDLSAIHVGDRILYHHPSSPHEIIVTKVLDDGIEFAQGATSSGIVTWNNADGTPLKMLFTDLYDATRTKGFIIYTFYTPFLETLTLLPIYW